MIEKTIEDDVIKDFLNEKTFEESQSCCEDKNSMFKDQTTVFMNKYHEDVDVPSIANKLADMIVEYEVAKK